MIAILDCFSGIAGDMTLGALIDCGLDPAWLTALPTKLGLDGVTVRIQDVRRSEIACKKVDFDIPPQPHGRSIHDIRRLVEQAGVPASVRDRANAAFSAIASAEGEIHGVEPEEVHLHEVGAVDAILDVVGVMWGFEQLGVTEVYCGTIAVGDGSVKAAHGILPVPAPATLKLLEGHPVRSGPSGAGELVTPTGAAIVKVLSRGAPPAEWIPVKSGYGAGTKDPAGRPNALRIILAEHCHAGNGSGAHDEQLILLAADVDDLTGEYLAAAADKLRASGALDVVLLSTIMKKGRPGTRIEALAREANVPALERILLTETTTIGVRRSRVERTALAREARVVDVLGHPVRLKVVALPGGELRAKAELDDVTAVAAKTGRSPLEIRRLADEAVKGPKS